MNALLLAAGLGTRLMPITKKTPKCLIKINGIPILDYWIKSLLSVGVDKIFINTFHLSHLVEKFIERNPHRGRVVLLSEAQLLGTGGSVKKYKNLLTTETTLIAHADNLCLTNFDDFLDFHHLQKSPDITLMTFVCDNPSECGIVSLNSSQKVTSFQEKMLNPPGNLANGAVYLMSQQAIEKISKIPQTKFDLVEGFLSDHLDGVHAWHNNFYHLDIGSHQALKRLESDKHLIKSLCFKFGVNFGNGVHD